MKNSTESFYTLINGQDIEVQYFYVEPDESVGYKGNVEIVRIYWYCDSVKKWVDVTKLLEDTVYESLQEKIYKERDLLT